MRAGINEAEGLERIMHSAEITWSARDYNIVESVRAASRVWHNMIVLHPHCLKRSVLIDVSWSPWQRLWICRVNSFPDLSSDHWNPTESTMIAVTLK